jgi:uncharacterized iron-regulated membrane protein
MPFLQTLLHHPRKLLLRRALFQIHLWSGVLLSAYVVVIALTGAILVFRTEVFRTELTRAQFPQVLHAYDPHHTAPIATVVASFNRAYPHSTLTNLITPAPQTPVYLLTASDPQRHPLRLLADPVTAQIHPQPRTWLDWIYDLHVYLLLGSAHGMQINGIGATILLLLTLTGLALWWPGIRIWTRGLRIDFRRNRRRINFDAHNAIGFWTLFVVSWWAISGIYFAWYRQIAAAVAIVSPIQGMASPAAPHPPADPTRIPLAQLLEAIHHAAPNGRLYSLSDPALKGQTVYALVDLRAPGDFSHRDILTLSTTDARVLTTWHYGQNHTLGDWFLWAMHPLHFGTLWGLPIKILWAIFGLALAVLTVTGLIMYWNRYLRHQLRSPNASVASNAQNR